MRIQPYSQSSTFSKASRLVFDQNYFEARRNKFLSQIEDNSLVIIPNQKVSIRSLDTEYKFRVDSDFYYLTGIDEPDVICVFKKEKNNCSYILFVKPRDKDKEIWVGKSIGLEGAKSIYKAHEAYPLSDFDKELSKLIKGVEHIYIPFGRDPELDLKITKLLGNLKVRNREAVKTPKGLFDPRDIIHKMRLIKDENEIAIMQKAAKISMDAHKLAIESVKPGMFEYEIEALVDGYFRERGGVGPAYSSIVGSGENATVLHYIKNDRKIKKNDLVLLDTGCEYGYYASDITRTFPVSKSFTLPQGVIYELVLEAQEKAIKKVKPGTRYIEVYDEAASVIAQGLKDLGLLKESLKEIIEEKLYKKFFMHRIGHWLGLDVHDVGPYIDSEGNPIKLTPGMVLTVEPGIYISPEADGVPKEFKGIGVRIEDDVLVTEKGQKVLTSGLSKRVSDILAMK